MNEPLVPISKATSALTKADQEQLLKDELGRQQTDRSVYDPTMLPIKILKEIGKFERPTGDTVSEIIAIIAYATKDRTWFRNADDNDETVYCRSMDGRLGVPTDDGKEAIEYLQQAEPMCGSCPANEWGSHPNRDRAKACTEKRATILLPEGATMAEMLRIPTGSIWAKDKKYGFDNFCTRVSQAGKLLVKTWVRIWLEIDNSNSKMVFSRARFDFADRDPLSDEEALELIAQRDSFAVAVGASPNEPDHIKPAYGDEVAQAKSEGEEPPPHEDEDESLPF